MAVLESVGPGTTILDNISLPGSRTRLPRMDIRQVSNNVPLDSRTFLLSEGPLLGRQVATKHHTDSKKCCFNAIDVSPITVFRFVTSCVSGDDW